MHGELRQSLRQDSCASLPSHGMDEWSVISSPSVISFLFFRWAVTVLTPQVNRLHRCACAWLHVCVCVCVGLVVAGVGDERDQTDMKLTCITNNKCTARCVWRETRWHASLKELTGVTDVWTGVCVDKGIKLTHTRDTHRHGCRRMHAERERKKA
mmetsp:Transcript_7751/g.19039  ORF Transcript_7751/g.19039 Transcript_7751/m.19039 type:complete len:155 (-) Transcript_7751:584-1048(-)